MRSRCPAQASAFKLRGTAGGKLADQAFAHPRHIPELHTAFLASIDTKLREAVAKLDSYLDDAPTEQVLVSLAKNQIVDVYKAFFDLVRIEYLPEVGLALSSVPEVGKLVEGVLPEGLKNKGDKVAAAPVEVALAASE